MWLKLQTFVIFEPNYYLNQLYVSA